MSRSTTFHMLPDDLTPAQLYEELHAAVADLSPYELIRFVEQKVWGKCFDLEESHDWATPAAEYLIALALVFADYHVQHVAAGTVGSREGRGQPLPLDHEGEPCFDSHPAADVSHPGIDVGRDPGPRSTASDE
jgi:hypothetical protein